MNLSQSQKTMIVIIKAHVQHQAEASEQGAAATIGRRTRHVHRLTVNEHSDLASVDVDIVAQYQSYEL